MRSLDNVQVCYAQPKVEIADQVHTILLADDESKIIASCGPAGCQQTLEDAKWLRDVWNGLKGVENPVEFLGDLKVILQAFHARLGEGEMKQAVTKMQKQLGCEETV